MPPQISDDERSDDDVMSEEEPVPVTKKTAAKEKRIVPDTKAKKAIEEEEEDGEKELMIVESDKDDDEDDEEIGEDEYVVEKILSHLVVEETGQLLFEVKWEGYEKKSERTWEPEENLLETAAKILNEYLASVGGREAIMEAFEDEKKNAGAKKGKKRGRSSTTGENGSNGTTTKRGRKSHPADASPPASATKSAFKPPTGSWEDDVTEISACEGEEGKVVVYLTWRGGHKTQHPLAQVYKRCPQKMLSFYESHLVFKKADSTDA